MGAAAWKIYDSFIPKMTTLETANFKCALFTSVLVPVDTDDLYSALANEVANGNGYVTAGVALTTVALSEAAGVSTMTCDDITWNASGGDIVARYAIIYNSDDSQLVAMCLLDSTPADVTVGDGLPMTISSTSGVFTVSGGW